MNTAAMTIVAVTDTTSILDLAASPTVVFVSRTDDGSMKVRYSGPAASGVATLPGDAPLFSVLCILRAAHGDGDGVTPLLATFVPRSGSRTLGAQDIHTEGDYTAFVRAHAFRRAAK